MEKHFLPIVAITIRNLPDSIIKEVNRIQVRVRELEEMRNTLRDSSDYEKCYMLTCRKIYRIIHQAREGIRMMNEYEKGRDPKLSESAFLHELQDHCWHLWEDPLKDNR